MKQKKIYAVLAVLVVVILGVYFATSKQSSKTTKKEVQTESQAKQSSKQKTKKAESSSEAKQASSSSVKKAKISETQAQDIVLKAHPDSKIEGNERRQSSGRDYYIVYYTDSDGTAKAAYVDVSSGEILYERDASE